MTPCGRGERREPERIADPQRRDVGFEVLGHLHRQRLDVQLVRHLRQDAAFLHAGRLAVQVERHRGVDRLVEAHFLQVDVGDQAAHRILLVVLEHRGMRLPAVDDDVEHGVQPALRGQRGAEIALGDRDRHGSLAAVEDAGDQTLAPQAARLGRAEHGTVLDHQFDALSSHDAAV